MIHLNKCPKCHSSLQKNSGGYICIKCNTVFTDSETVPYEDFSQYMVKLK